MSLKYEPSSEPLVNLVVVLLLHLHLLLVVLLLLLPRVLEVLSVLLLLLQGFAFKAHRLLFRV